MSGAFFNDEALKQALLQDIRDEGPIRTAWLTPAVIEADAGVLAAKQGLHPAIGALLPVLGVYGHEAGASAFYEAAIEAVPVGADGADIVRRWYLAAWSHPDYGFRNPLMSTPLLDPAQAVIDLVKESRSGEIAPARWRKARATLSAAADAASLDMDIANPVLSMGWDLERTPASAADVANAWGGPIAESAYRSDDWSDADDEAFGAHYGAFNQQALARIGEPRQGDPEQYAQFKAILKELWDSTPETQVLWRRSEARKARADAIISAWRDEARRLFIVSAASAAS
ncbi:hypothetical protein D3C71_182110 [compost metagenome]